MISFIELILNSSKFKFLLLSNFLELSTSVLRLHEIVVNCSDSCLLIAVFPCSVVIQVIELGNLVLVFSLFLLESLHFVLKVVDFLSKREALVTLLGGI